jgi:hypothetical protein
MAAGPAVELGPRAPDLCMEVPAPHAYRGSRVPERETRNTFQTTRNIRREQH